MNDCTEFQDLISAYVDGELTEADKASLEAHMSACADCSAILEIYRSISTAVDGSLEPAPESLHTGVMEKIRNADDAQLSARIRKFKTVNVIFSRYVPIAACLVFILLVAARLFGGGGLLNKSDSGSTSLEAAPSSAPSSAANAAGGSMNLESQDEQDSNARDEGGFGGTAGMNDSASPPAAAPNPDAPPLETADDQARNGNNAATNPAAAAPSAAPSAELGPPQMSGQEAEDAKPEPEEVNDGMAANVAPDMDEPESVLLPGVYAVIMIRGKLPALLSEYEPEDAATGGVRFYILPRAAADALIAEISGSAGVSVNLSDENGEYAHVYYTPGE